VTTVTSLSPVSEVAGRFTSAKPRSSPLVASGFDVAGRGRALAKRVRSRPTAAGVAAMCRRWLALSVVKRRSSGEPGLTTTWVAASRATQAQADHGRASPTQGLERGFSHPLLRSPLGRSVVELASRYPIRSRRSRASRSRCPSSHRSRGSRSAAARRRCSAWRSFWREVPRARPISAHVAPSARAASTRKISARSSSHRACRRVSRWLRGR